MAKKLGEILVENKHITEEQLKKALKRQEKSDEKLGQILIDMGYVSMDVLMKVLEDKLGITYVNIWDFDLHDQSGQLKKIIPKKTAKKINVIPLKRENDVLKVAMDDPTDLRKIEDLKQITGYKIEPYLTNSIDIKQGINEIYSEVDQEIQEVTVNSQRTKENLRELARGTSIVVELVNSIIDRGINLGATDIHIKPRKEDLQLKYRIDGILKKEDIIPKEAHSPLISRLKVLGNLDINEEELPQDGKLDVSSIDTENKDMRISTMPTINGEKAVIRLLHKREELLNIENLGFSKTNLKKFKDIITKAYGMVLLTGPAGSGKSTTVYAALNKLNKTSNNIVTVEDPVENTFEYLTQIEVNRRKGRTFAKTLRSILRQDPDIIMVGEIRDQETARIAVRAALTGHLVFSTLHANHCSSTITRLMSMGISPFLATSAVNGVIAQRMVRRLCQNCHRKYLPSKEKRKILDLEKGQKLYKAEGCKQCNFEGYQGLLTLQEIIVVDSELGNNITEEVQESKIEKIAREKGMITLKEDGINKLKKGLTTYEQVAPII